MTSYNRHGPWQLSALHLEGFKAFRDSTTIPLRPLTLLFGANSAGKSTILQALYLLRQSMTADTPSMHLRLRGPRVIRPFGTFVDVLSHGLREGQQKMTVGVSAAMRDDPDSGEQTLRFVTNGPSPANTDVLRIDHVSVASEHGAFLLFQAPSPGVRTLRSLSGQTEESIFLPGWTSQLVVGHPLIDQCWDRRGSIDWSRFKLRDNNQVRVSDVSESQDRVSFDHNLARLFDNEIRPRIERQVPGLGFYTPISWKLRRHVDDEQAGFWGAWSEPYHALRGTIGSLLYIPPMREVPSRDLFVPVSGERVFSDAAASGRSVQSWHAWGPASAPAEWECRQMEDRVNAWLRRLDVGVEIEWQGLYSQSNGEGLMRAASLGCRQLGPDRATRFMHLSDVGFGVSQILPIVVNLMMTERRLVTIEQPEVHVHPALQAELGDCLAEAVVKQGHQVICETHSEHVVLRLQKLVRTRKLDPNLVTICCVTKGASGAAKITEVRLDADGGMLGDWPGGFFSERLNELWDR